MKCINTKIGEHGGYGGLCNILVDDSDKRNMDEIYTSLDPILDIIDMYCDLKEAIEH